MSKAKLRAEAIDRFVTDAKAQGVYDSLKAACILTGWDTLAGALTPLVGSAPTNNGFVAADYDRGGQGLKGNGSSKYLDSNRAGDADGQDDVHTAAFMSQVAVTANSLVGSGGAEAGSTGIFGISGSSLGGRSRSTSAFSDLVDPVAIGFAGMSRSDSATASLRNGSISAQSAVASQTPYTANYYVFRRSGIAPYGDARLSWYSIGSSVDLAALDTLVTRLMADLRAIEEDGMDRDALAYIRAVEAADGSFMVTGVKNAVDRLVKGLKYDRDANGRSAWDAIGASCLLCGPRTIAGALVPLKGVAPTAYNFVSADYNQETGLVGDGATKYLDSNRANNADGQNDVHMTVYKNDTTSAANPYFMGDIQASGQSAIGQNGMYLRSIPAFADTGFASSAVGLHGASRANASGVTFKRPGLALQSAAVASSTPTATANDFVFALNSSGSATQHSASRLAYYSIGASLSLSALDSRITKYVSDVAAAIP